MWAVDLSIADRENRLPDGVGYGIVKRVQMLEWEDATRIVDSGRARDRVSVVVDFSEVILNNRVPDITGAVAIKYFSVDYPIVVGKNRLPDTDGTVLPSRRQANGVSIFQQSSDEIDCRLRVCVQYK